MPRELSQAEVKTFLETHPQLVYSTIPTWGIAVKDGDRYILVWMDAVSRWHYVDVTDSTQFAELIKNKPAFVSPDSSLIENLFRELGQTAELGGGWLKWVVVGLGIVLAIVFLVEARTVVKDFA